MFGISDMIEHRCRQLGRSGLSRGSAVHLARWMKGQLGQEGTPEIPENEIEVWSPERMRRKAQEISTTALRALSRCEEIDLSDHEQRSTDDSQKTVKSFTGQKERLIAVCRKCQKTCLLNSNLNAVNINNQIISDVNANPTIMDDDIVFTDEGTWNQKLKSSTFSVSPSDPFHPIPQISIVPPSPTIGSIPTSNSGNNNSCWTIDDQKSVTDNQKYQSDIGDGDDSDGEIEDPPYRSLSPCGLRRFGTLSSLEKLDISEDTDEDTVEQDLPQDGLSQFETVSQSIRGWTVRAGTYVAEKIGLLDKCEETSSVSFVDKYLRSSQHSEELIATSTALAGEEDCETSCATSENDVWGTPTSGGSELTSPNTEFADSPTEEASLLEAMLGGTGVTISWVGSHLGSRGILPQRRRLEPLPEAYEEETTSSSSTTTPADLSDSFATKSCHTDQGNKSDSCPSRTRSATSTPRFLDKLKLRRSQSADSRPTKPKKFMEFLRSTKSEEHTSSSTGSRLMRLFSRESQDDIPTSVPPEFIQKREQEKTNDRRFWKQLCKRKSPASTGSLSPKTTISAT